MTDVPKDALRVVVRYKETTDHYEHSGEQYGSWSESRTFEVKGARVVHKNYKTVYEEEGFLVPADTGTVYVLYMRYSDGDSFGHCDGKGAILGCFGNRDVAMAAEAEVQKQRDEFQIAVKDDFGREITIRNPGAGYFEHIDDIEIVAFVI